MKDLDLKELGSDHQTKHKMLNVDDKVLARAWRELETSLRQANKLYLNQNDGGRAAAIHQLIAVSRFISSASRRDRLLQMPLIALSLALYYLNLGVIEPMLAPPSRRSRRGRRPEQDALKLRSAVAMSQLYEIGYSRKDAGKRIATELEKLGFKTTAEAVEDWRDHFRRLPQEDAGGKLFRSMLASENKSIGRDTEQGRVEADQRPKFARLIIETFRKFVVLGRLTSNPNLGKVWPQLLKTFQT